MYRSEALEYEMCAGCGTEVVAADRAYAFEERVLCYGCSLARGGAYDEVHDRWSPAPDISDLRPD